MDGLILVIDFFWESVIILQWPGSNNQSQADSSIAFRDVAGELTNIMENHYPNDVSKEFKVLNRSKWLALRIFILVIIIIHVQSCQPEIEKGEIRYLVPNGAGKSTTIKMMTGVLEPTRRNTGQRHSNIQKRSECYKIELYLDSVHSFAGSSL